MSEQNELYERRKAEAIKACARHLHCKDRAGDMPWNQAMEQAYTFQRLAERDKDVSLALVAASVRYWREVERQATDVVNALESAGYHVVKMSPNTN